MAQHVALGHRVGLCDLTARRDGQQRHAWRSDEAEAEAAATSLGARWRVNLRPARRGPSSRAPTTLARVAGWSARRGRARWRCRTGSIGIPITCAASDVLTEAVFSAGLRRFDADGRGLEARAGSCYYFINDHAAPSFVVDVSDDYEIKRRALACHVSQFAPEPPTRSTRGSPRCGSIS